MIPLLAATSLAGVSGTVTAVGFVTDVTGGGDPASIAPYLQSGGTLGLITGLMWVVWLFVTGRIVSKPVADYMKEIGAAVQIAGNREAKLIHLTEDYQGLLQRVETTEEGRRRQADDLARLQSDLRLLLDRKDH